MSGTETKSVVFLLGRAGCGKTRACLDGAARFLAAADRGSPFRGPNAILLVPPQATYFAELQLLRHLEATAGLRGYSRGMTLSFRRLAMRVFRETGEPAFLPADSLKKRLLVRRLLYEAEPELTAFRKAARSRLGFAGDLVDLFRELHAQGVTPEGMKEALDAARADASGPGDSLEKLRDAALLFARYRNLIQQAGGRDPDLDLGLAARGFPHAPFLKGARVWADGFPAFSRTEMDALAALALNVRSLEIALCLDPALAEGEPSAADGPAGLFHPTLETFHALRERFEKDGLKTVVRSVGREAKRFRSAGLRALESGFPGTGRPAGVKPEGDVRLVQAPNRRAEAVWIASEVRRLVLEEGRRHRDIAVLARDLESWSGLLETAFEEWGIPFFLDERKEIRRHPYIVLLLSALSTIENGWRTTDALDYLKAGFVFPDDPNPADQLENFVIENGLSGRDWTQGGGAWRERVPILPFGPDEETGFDPLDEGGEETSVPRDMETLRKQAVAELVAFENALTGGAGAGTRMTATAFEAAVQNLVRALHVEDRIREWERRESGPSSQESSIHRQAWNAVVEFFHSFTDILGDEPVDLAELIEIARTGLAELRLGAVPSALDQILIGSVDRSRQPPLSVCFVAGFNDRVWPRTVGNKAVFNDRDRGFYTEKLALRGLNPAAAELKNETYLAYIALTRASERLYLSWSSADESGRELKPSLYLGRIRKLFPGLEVIEASDDSDPAAMENARSPARALSAVAHALRSKNALRPVWPSLYSILLKEMLSHEDRFKDDLLFLQTLDLRNSPPPLSRESIDAWLGEELKTSVSRLEAYASCPFKHFVRYGLKLRERKAFQMGAPESGTLYHEALRAAFEELREKCGGWGKANERDLRDAARRGARTAAEKLLPGPARDDPRNHYLVEIARERLEPLAVFLGRLEFHSAFKQVYAELSFGGSGDAFPALVLDLSEGRRLAVKGKIDRIDADSDRPDAGGLPVRVIDYKLRSSSRARLDRTRVEAGLDLQLMTYLLYVTKMGGGIFNVERVRPASAFYAPVRNAFRTGDSALEGPGPDDVAFFEENRLTGVADERFLNRMDLKTLPGEKSPFYKFQLGANGSVRYGKNEFLTGEGIESLLDITQENLKTLGERIFSGELDIAPAKCGDWTACDYCEYGGVCRFDPESGANAYREIEGNERPESGRTTEDDGA